MSHKRHHSILIVALLVCVLLLVRRPTWAQQISPTATSLDPGMDPVHISLTMMPEQSASRTLRVTTGENPIDKGDVMFVFDLTGSMGDELAEAKTSATEIMNEVVTTMPNTWFGIASFMDYPGYFSYSGYSDYYGDAAYGDLPWILNRNPTADIPQVSATINDLKLGYGADTPESYSRMLYELDKSVSWRHDSKKVAVVFGDAPTHDLNFNGSNYGGDPGPDNTAQTGDDVDFETVVGNLRDKGVSILAVNSGGDEAEPTFRGMSEGFATTAGTRGAYYLLGQTEDLPEKTVELILAETAIIDQMMLEVTEGFEDWVNITPDSHSAVGPNSTVEFNVTFRVPDGTEPGYYPFVVRAVGDGIILGFAYVQIIVPGTDATTDIGFLPSEDGFNFVNSGSAPVPGPTWAMFRQFFGSSVVEYPNGDRIHAASKFFDDKYSRSGRGGSCDGFTSSSLLNYFDLPQANAGDFAMPVYSSLYNWNRNDDMEDAIAFNQAKFYGLELLYHHSVLGNNVKNSPKAMFEYLKQAIANGEPMIAYIQWKDRLCNPFPFNFCQDPGAHSLLPYRIDEVNSDTAHVYVYDPNRPGDNDRRIEFDLTDNTWTYDWHMPLSPDIEITGDDSYLSISFAPLDLYTHQGLAPWLSIFSVNRDEIPQPTYRTFNMSGALKILFTDDEGRRLGFEGDTFVAEIPDAHYFLDAFGAGEVPSGTFLIPDSAVVDITLSAPDTGEGFLQTYGQGYMIDLSLTEIAAGSTAILDVGGNGHYLSLSPQAGTFTANLTVNLLLAEEDRTVSMVGAVLEAGETLGVNLALLEPPATEDVIGISGYLLREKMMGFSLHRAGGDGYSAFGSAELTMNNAFDARVALPDWSNLNSLSLEIDWNQDGQVDEVVDMENQAIPDFVQIEASQTSVTGLETGVELEIAVKDQFGTYIANGTPVFLQSDSGQIAPAESMTSGGFVQSNFTPDKYGVATITVSAGSAQASIEIKVEQRRLFVPILLGE